MGTFTVPGVFPEGIAFDSSDNFYAADCPRCGGFSGPVTIYKFAAGTFSSPTVFASGFTSAAGIEFSPSGQLFVADFYGGQIWQVTPGGTTQSSHTLWASGLTKPANVAFDTCSGVLFAGAQDRVIKIPAPGTVITFASGFTASPGQGVHDLDFDNTGNVYVDDLAAGQIWKFTTSHPCCQESDGNGDFQGQNGQNGNFNFDNDGCMDGDQNQVSSTNLGDGKDFKSTQISTTKFDSVAHTVTITGLGTHGGVSVAFTFVAVETGPTTPGWVSFAFSDGYTNAGTLVSGSILLH
jgi:hypothetical protein